MTTPVFGETYAAAYDILYKDKDYDGECNLLERIFRQYRAAPVRKVLDIGCGTGNHALRLAQRGYAVSGVDRSAAMIQIARRKAHECGLRVCLNQADAKSLDLAETFDAVLMMFAVLGYQQQQEGVLQLLRAARKHLAAAGLLIFDVWYGPAVEAQRPGRRARTVETDGQKVVRTASAQLDAEKQICSVQFHVRHFKGNSLIRETRERHSMRYFFAKELSAALQSCGLRLLRLGAFPNFDHDANESTWNVLAVAEAV
jgi:SAM-dependent methyltransferase